MLFIERFLVLGYFGCLGACLGLHLIWSGLQSDFLSPLLGLVLGRELGGAP